MSRLFIADGDRCGLDLALRSIAQGHDVRLFRPPGLQVRDGEGFPKLQITSDLKGGIKWAGKDGLVVTTANCKYMDELDRWRAFGYNIFSPTKASAKLEIDRALGMEVMKQHGMNIPTYHEFKSLPDALAFARKADQAYVFKTLGSEEDKSLTFVPKDPAQLVGWIEKKIKAGMRLKGPCMLQEKIDMVAEVGIAGYMGSQGFLQDKWEISFEHKKLMSGNYGPSTGEQGTVIQLVKQSKLADILKSFENHVRALGHMGDIAINGGIDTKGEYWPFEWTCYDPETEVLTKAGWKLFKDVQVGEPVASLNPDTWNMEYKPALKVIEKDFTGELIHFRGDRSACDLLVTPDHSMFAYKYSPSHRTGPKWDFYTAEEVAAKGSWKIKRSANWVGEDAPTFTLPGYTEKHFLGRAKTYVHIEHPDIAMPMDVWLKFLGLYLSEGSMGKNDAYGVPYQVSITQPHDSVHLSAVRDMLKDFPIRPAEDKKGFIFASRQLCLYMHGMRFGRSASKYIPEDLLDLSPKWLNHLLDALMEGDGSVHHRSGQRTYYTTSPRLADQLQELILKTGGLARITKRDTKGTKMSVGGGKEYTRNHDMYRIVERKHIVDGWLDKRMAKRVPYTGKVYCLNVPPYHLLYVRRNGNPAWSGNCRAGWPDDYIRRSLHTGDDEVKWMLDACKGEDTLEVSYDTAIGVVMAQKPYPYEDGLPDVVEGNPIYGVDEVAEHVHFAQVMLGRGPVWDGKKIKDDRLPLTTGAYIAVVTGHGKTVMAANKAVYGNVKKLSLADALIRDDIGEALKTPIEKLKALGYPEMPDWE